MSFVREILDAFRGVETVEPTDPRVVEAIASFHPERRAPIDPTAEVRLPAHVPFDRRNKPAIFGRAVKRRGPGQAG